MKNNDAIRPNKRFYVYTLADEDDNIFYVGKGTGDRISHHEKEARTGCVCTKCDRIRYVWGSGCKVIRTIVFESDVEAAAHQKERKLIQSIGRQSLCNKTSGGEGYAGKAKVIISLETFRRQERALLRAALKNLSGRGLKARKQALIEEFDDRESRAIALAEWIEDRVQEDAIQCQAQGVIFKYKDLYQRYAWITIRTPRKYWSRS